jgi:hypothetical protein|tara:strand:- start:34 stop:270 length:237 start_codon:yes stop_codon:yes gene_type:complete
MSIKCFCDNCGKEIKVEGFAEEIDGDGWDRVRHYYPTGIVHEDRNNEEVTGMYHHTCKECDLEDLGEDSYYYEEANEH